MKTKILFIGALSCSLALAAFAVQPRFKTLADGGNASSTGEVTFPADPSSQIRIVSTFYGSDTNNGVLSFSGGSAVFSITQTNAATTSVTNLINSTNGLSASAVLVLQHGGVCYTATASSWASSSTTVTNGGVVTGGTNVVLASGGWGVATSIGDSVYLMDTPVAIPVGATTNSLNGTSIYAATYSGRPVKVKLSVPLATNNLYSVTSIYE